MASGSSRYLFLERDVREPIRFSSYGVMYGAKNIMTGEKVRIKVYEEKDRERAKRFRFYKEVYLFQELWDCRYLVQLIEYKKMDDQLHRLVIENIPTGMFPLSVAVVEVRRIKSLFYQFLKTLESLHCQEMLFQLNPENVYFNEDTIKVDGISGMVMSKTFDDKEIITPLRYKAPELCLQYGAQNSCSDIWCLACIMAEVVLNCSLFVCNDDDATWILLDQCFASGKEYEPNKIAHTSLTAWTYGSIGSRLNKGYDGIQSTKKIDGAKHFESPLFQ
ncbi:PREDICTED: cyclin-dependent kinase 2-like [Prunus mume]|uniref:Cyclin-dependent kinase 2-like n=1 Tax=Prunus mume TaxID=102107 RepID=A0ABM0P1R7_PRUMU|nr:PREDICTED: cyclin-dependent kinase 2-like [Prunus mume]